MKIRSAVSDQPLVVYVTSISYVGYEKVFTQNYFVNSSLVGYSFGQKIEFSVQTGLYWGVYLNSKWVVRSFHYGDPEEMAIIDDPRFPIGYHETIDEYEGDPSDYKKLDYGVIIQSRISYNFTDLLDVFVAPNIYFGLKDISTLVTVNDVEIYNRSICINIGIKFRL